MPHATDRPPNAEQRAQVAYSALLEHCAGCTACKSPEPPEEPCTEAQHLAEAYRLARREARGVAS